MRIKLGELLGQNHWFTATFVRPVYRSRWGKETALLRDVRLMGQSDIKTDHAWVLLTSEVDKVPLGADITFNADVSEYCKLCGDQDFFLENLNSIRW
jgi:hypothetical protein